MRSLKSSLITWSLPAIPMRTWSQDMYLPDTELIDRRQAILVRFRCQSTSGYIDRPGTSTMFGVMLAGHQPIVNREEDTSVTPNRSPRQPINGTRQPAISDKSRRFRSDDRRSALEPRVFPECSPQLVSGLLPDRSFPRGFSVVRRGPHF